MHAPHKYPINCRTDAIDSPNKGTTLLSSSDALLKRFRVGHAAFGGINLALGPAYRNLLAELGDPHLKLPPVFHVAGTNGKGSVCAFLRAMLEAGGYKVHVYTSPHLVHFH